jgi:acid phosphatase (class A)
MHRWIGPLAGLLLAGCATTQASAPPPPTSIAEVGELRAGLGIAKGYLAPESLPDSLALVPAPPAAGSAAMAADEEAFRAAAAASAERFALAAADADLRWPQAVAGYEAVLGRSVSSDATPHTAMLLRRAMADAGLSTYRAKTHYQRVRPFVVNSVASCTPQDEAALRGDGSYPSGHAAIGWMLALALTDLAPQQTDALLKRGYDFGESRMVCRVHWKSDVAAGRLMASAAYARLQSDPVFKAQRELARAELAAAR